MQKKEKERIKVQASAAFWPLTATHFSTFSAMPFPPFSVPSGLVLAFCSPSSSDVALSSEVTLSSVSASVPTLLLSVPELDADSLDEDELSLSSFA